MVPALAPFSSWPRGLVRECCPAGRPLDFYTIATHLQPMVIPTPGPFLVRASRLLYEYGLPLVDLLDLLCLPPPMQLTSGDGAPGPCQMFVLWESAGLALFRSLTVPLLGSVPSRCCRFTLLALVAVLWLLVVFRGTGWASTSIDNLCPLFHLSSNVRFLTIQRVI